MFLLLIDGKTAHNTAKDNLIDVILFQQIRLLVQNELHDTDGFWNNFGLDSSLMADLLNTLFSECINFWSDLIV